MGIRNDQVTSARDLNGNDKEYKNLKAVELQSSVPSSGIKSARLSIADDGSGAFIEHFSDLDGTTPIGQSGGLSSAAVLAGVLKNESNGPEGRVLKVGNGSVNVDKLNFENSLKAPLVPHPGGVVPAHDGTNWYTQAISTLLTKAPSVADMTSAYYKISVSGSVFNTGTDEIDLSGFSQFYNILQDGDLIRLSVNTNFSIVNNPHYTIGFAKKISGNKITIHPTYKDAINNLNKRDIIATNSCTIYNMTFDCQPNAINNLGWVVDLNIDPNRPQQLPTSVPENDVVMVRMPLKNTTILSQSIAIRVPPYYDNSSTTDFPQGYALGIMSITGSVYGQHPPSVVFVIPDVDFGAGVKFANNSQFYYNPLFIFQGVDLYNTATSWHFVRCGDNNKWYPTLASSS